MFVTSETMQGPECKELRLLRFNISGLWVRSIIIKGLGAIWRYRNKVKLNFNVGT